jgi:hypothetical protein
MKLERMQTHKKLALLAAICCLLTPLAAAHVGPPFPIVVDQQIGTCKISIWTHPDIGLSAFFVLVDPMPGTTVPSDLKMDIGVQPVSGRWAEVVYPMDRQNNHGQVQYNAQVEFDRQEFFRVRVHLQSATVNGEAISQVEATPTGFGRWDLLFYLSPFLLIVIVFYRGVRKKRKKLAQQAQPA